QTNGRADTIRGSGVASLQQWAGPVLAQQLHTDQVPLQASAKLRSRRHRIEVDGQTRRQDIIVGGQCFRELFFGSCRLIGIHGGPSISCWSRSIALSQSLRTAFSERPSACATSENERRSIYRRRTTSR